MVGEIVMKQFNLEKYLKNPNRKIITRDGHDVRIICSDCKNYKYPIVALVTCDDDEFVVNCTKEGKCHTPNKYKYDLFFAPEKHEGWINVYEEGTNRYLDGCICVTKEEAKRIRGYGYITTIKIEWEE